jgi:hypothetical protein
MNAEDAKRLQMRGQYLSRINTVIDDPKTHPEGNSIVDICIAVKPM